MYHTEHQCFYNTRHKSLKQKPFPLNFLLRFLHSLFTHLICSHSEVPISSCISFPNVEQRVFWSTKTTVIPKLTIGKGKHKSQTYRLHFVFSYERFDNVLICMISRFRLILNFPIFRKDGALLELEYCHGF